MRLAVLALLVATLGGGPLAAQAVTGAELEARVKETSSQLRCPVCQGLSLQDSPSELSEEMKDLVREQLASGKSPDEVKAYFVAKYGEWILLRPEARGFNLAVYALPAIALVGGALVVLFAVRRWTAGAVDTRDEIGVVTTDELRDTRETLP